MYLSYTLLLNTLMNKKFHCYLLLYLNLFVGKVDDDQWSEFCDTYLDYCWTPDEISVYGQTKQTNNSVESFHAFLKKRICGSHPNVWSFLSLKNRIFYSKNILLANRNNGIEAMPRRCNDQLIKEGRIKDAENEFELDGVAEAFLVRVSVGYGKLIDDFDSVDGKFYFDYYGFRTLNFGCVLVEFEIANKMEK